MTTDVYHFFIALKGRRKPIVSKRPFLSYSGATGALQGRLTRMRPDALAKLEATAVVKNVNAQNFCRKRK